MADSKGLQLRVNNLNETLEKDLNIGIFQFDDYIAFYINLTAYEEYVNSQGSIIFERKLYRSLRLVLWFLFKDITELTVYAILKYQLGELSSMKILEKTKPIVELIWLYFHMKKSHMNHVPKQVSPRIQPLSITIDSFSCVLMKESLIQRMVFIDLVEILSKLSRTGVRKLTKGFSTIRKFGVYRSFEFINYSCFWWSECDCQSPDQESEGIYRGRWRH